MAFLNLPNLSKKLKNPENPEIIWTEPEDGLGSLADLANAISPSLHAATLGHVATMGAANLTQSQTVHLGGAVHLGGGGSSTFFSSGNALAFSEDSQKYVFMAGPSGATVRDGSIVLSCDGRGACIGSEVVMSKDHARALLTSLARALAESAD